MIELVAQIEYNLRMLFKDKDRLVGVDDWDTFIAVLVMLKELRSGIQELEKPKEEE